MQVDLTSVVGILSTVCTLAFAAWLAVARVAYNNRETSIDHRFEKVEGKQETMDIRLHTEEKHTIRQDGDIKLVGSSLENINSEIHGIRRDMVTKSEFNAFTRSMEQVLSRLEGRRYSSGQAYSAQQTTPVTDPPRPSPRRPGSSPDR